MGSFGFTLVAGVLKKVRHISFFLNIIGAESKIVYILLLESLPQIEIDLTSENNFLILSFLAFTGFETNNKYKVKNSLGQNVFFAVEGRIDLLAFKRFMLSICFTNTKEV